MIASQLVLPRYSQPEVLQVTRLRPAVLQTWMNRQAIKLSDQNPGYGRRRLYSMLDVVKLAVMRRMADLQVALAVSREIAEAAADDLGVKGKMDWNLFIFLRPSEGTSGPTVSIIGSSPLIAYSPTVGDARHMRVSDYVEPFEGFLSRRDRKSMSEERPMNPDRRQALAREGVHGEPVIIFPLGEIVNGALAQLKAVDEARNGPHAGNSGEI